MCRAVAEQAIETYLCKHAHVHLCVPVNVLQRGTCKYHYVEIMACPGCVPVCRRVRLLLLQPRLTSLWCVVVVVETAAAKFSQIHQQAKGHVP